MQRTSSDHCSRPDLPFGMAVLHDANGMSENPQACSVASLACQSCCKEARRTAANFKDRCLSSHLQRIEHGAAERCDSRH